MRLLRPPPPRSLRVFCVAGRTRSFKVAAEELCLTASAVSHQIKELEDTLGVQLFARKTRALELTTAGYRLLREVGPLLDAMDRSVTQIARRGSRSKVRLVAPPFFAGELLIPRLGSLCAANPDVDIEVESSVRRPGAHAPTADVSILLTDAPPHGLQVTKLFPVELVAACAKQHAKRVAHTGAGIFAELSLVVHKSRPFAWSEWAMEGGLNMPEPKATIEVDTMSAAVSAAEHGLGIALVPYAVCLTRFRSGTLVPIFDLTLPTKDAYFLVSRPKDLEKPEVTAATTWMKEQFGRG